MIRKNHADALLKMSMYCIIEITTGINELQFFFCCNTMFALGGNIESLSLSVSQHQGDKEEVSQGFLKNIEDRAPRF